MNKIKKLEEQVMKCWDIVEDLNTVATGVLEHDWTADQTANAVLGMAELSNVKFDQLNQTLNELTEEYYELKKQSDALQRIRQPSDWFETAGERYLYG